MAAGLILATVTTTTGETIEQQFWVDDTASPTTFNPVTRVTWGPVTAQNTVDIASGKPLPVQVRSATGLIPWGEPTDAKSTATDTTSVSAISLLKQISASTQVSGVVGATTMSASIPVTIATDDARVGIVTETAPATDTASSGLNGRLQRIAQRITSLIALFPTSLGQTTKSASFPVTIASDQALGYATTLSTDITRPSDTNVYAANDAWSDSTSAPVSGGSTLTGAGRISGGSGIITDIFVCSSNDPATVLQGEIWIADTAMTNVNDNAAFAMADADVKNLIAVVPFTLASTVAGSGTNSFAHVQGLNIGFTCVGSANLRYIVKVKNAYTPASAEVLTVRAKIVQTN